MEIKLNSNDLLELRKAFAHGYLDIDKVSFLRALKMDYRPLRLIGGGEMDYYLQALYDGWGYVPTSLTDFTEAALQSDEQETIDKVERNSSKLYRRLVQNAFMGLLAIRALGGTFHGKRDPDFDWMDERPEF